MVIKLLLPVYRRHLRAVCSPDQIVMAARHRRMKKAESVRL